MVIMNTVKDQNLEPPAEIDLTDARNYFDEYAIQEDEWRELYKRKVIAVFDLYGDLPMGKRLTVCDVHEQACDETFAEWCEAGCPGFASTDETYHFDSEVI